MLKLESKLLSCDNAVYMDSLPIDTDTGPNVVLELIYRLKVKDVMKDEVYTVTPSDSMRTIQLLMKAKGITGVPVSENGRLAGLVSIGDIIEALDGGWINDAAEKHMSRAVIVLDADMPLSFAVTYFNRYGYRRFPVLDKNGNISGIITAADILRSLLIEMNKEVERLEEGLGKHVQGKHIDKDGKAGFDMRFNSKRFDFEAAGKASGELKKALNELGLDSAVIRRASIISYELEMNQVIHSVGGTMEFSAADGTVRITARDEGPGIADLDAAMTEGFSTANQWVRSLGFGAGLGLPNAKRSSDEFSITSKPGKGTTVLALIHYEEKT
ncbi:CBS domain-containing protein [Spirochaetota bacterium]